MGNLGSTLMAILKRLTPEMRGSVTFDNDTTFARHAWLRGMPSVAGSSYDVTFGHIGGIGLECSMKSICHA